MATSGDRVIVLGGGVAGVTAALGIARGAQQGADVEVAPAIEVVQLGWRLGGKGASGRNAAFADRIEEHGFHVWFGFYRNAFQSLATSYEIAATNEVPVGRSREAIPFADTAVASMADAFVGSTLVGVMEEHHGYQQPWFANFPDHPGLPWDDDAPTRAGVTPLELLRRGMRFTHRYLDAAGISAASDPTIERWLTLREMDRSGNGLFGRFVTEAGRLVDETPPSALWLFIAHELVEAATTDLLAKDSRLQGVLARLLRGAQRVLADHIAAAVDSGDPARRRGWQLVDLVSAIARGLVIDGVASGAHQLEELDEEDFRQWLRRHGASDLALDSGVVRACVYDLAFGYAAGDRSRPVAGAGTALRGLASLFFDYDGSIMYKMTAAMGDVVFVPHLVEMASHGIETTFFTRVERMGFDSVAFDRVERTIDPDLDWLLLSHQRPGGYDRPLIKVELPAPSDDTDGADRSIPAAKPVLSWPSRPLPPDPSPQEAWTLGGITGDRLESLLSDEELRWAYESSRSSLASALVRVASDRLERLLIRSAAPWPEDPTEPPVPGLWPPCPADHLTDDPPPGPIGWWTGRLLQVLDAIPDAARTHSLEFRSLTDGPAYCDPLKPNEGGVPLDGREVVRCLMAEEAGFPDLSGLTQAERSSFLAEAAQQEEAARGRGPGTGAEGGGGELLVDRLAGFEGEFEAAMEAIEDRLDQRLRRAEDGNEQFPRAAASPALIAEVRARFTRWTAEEFDRWQEFTISRRAPVFTKAADEPDPTYASERFRAILDTVSDHLADLEEARHRLRIEAVALASDLGMPFPPWSPAALREAVAGDRSPSPGQQDLVEDCVDCPQPMRDWLVCRWLDQQTIEPADAAGPWRRLVRSIYRAAQPTTFVSIEYREVAADDGAGDTPLYDGQRQIFAVRTNRGPLGLLQPIAKAEAADEPQLDDIEVDGEFAETLRVAVRCRSEGGVVVNAMPISTMARTAEQVLHCVPSWAAASNRIETVATQAAQVWHRRTGDDLGWKQIVADAIDHRPAGEDESGPTVGAFVPPFDTWADLTVTRDFERHDRATVGAISYFCSVLPTVDIDPSGGPWDGPLHVLAETLDYLDRSAKELWPEAGLRYPSAFDWEEELRGDDGDPTWPPDLRALLAPQIALPPTRHERLAAIGQTDVKVDEPVIYARKERVTRLRRQEQYAVLAHRLFVSANTDEANAYVLNAPGTSKYRLWPGDTGVGNVTFAGDWTRTIVNAGCVEAAVVSGLLAAESSLLQLGRPASANAVKGAIIGMADRAWPTPQNATVRRRR